METRKPEAHGRALNRVMRGTVYVSKNKDKLRLLDKISPPRILELSFKIN